MNLETARRTLATYRETLNDFGPGESGGLERVGDYPPEPGPFDRPPEESELNTHLATMLDKMEVFLEEVETLVDRPRDVTEIWDKFNRWLGFMQAVFWVQGTYTLDEMREHNRD